jgi:paraquat-inducible protein B
MSPSEDLPEPELRRQHRWSFSLIWLVPVVAALAALVLVVRTYLEAGPSVNITFETAEGLEAGKTEVRYKDVVVGKVRRITLTGDASHVVVMVNLNKDASKLAVSDTRFWVERPRVGISGISGIETLLSGAYIGVDIGTSDEDRKDFTGLEKPPAVTRDMKGKLFLLHTEDAGSLANGSPVYYHRVAVGKVVASDLDPDGRNVTVQLFVDAPYDRLVTENTRFWNASGIDVALGASGLKVNTQSLATVIAGGVAFLPYREEDPGPPAVDKADFHLFADQAGALAGPDGPPLQVLMHFDQPVRGLSGGAQVDFHGISFGTVTSIELQFDPQKQVFFTNVTAEVYPDRLAAALKSLRARPGAAPLSPAEMWRQMIERGLRAQLHSGNLITGQLYVVLDFVKHPQPASFDGSIDPVVIPTSPAGLDQLQDQLMGIVDKLDKIPFDQIGQNLNTTLKNASSLLAQMDQQIAPEAKAMLRDAQHAMQSLDRSIASPDAPLQQDARHTLQELNHAAASLRALADYLEQHPDSLIRGKPADQEPAGDSGRK